VESLLAAEAESENFLQSHQVAKLASALLNADTSHSRQRIGHYKILRELGHGGMGVVYLAVRDDDHYRKQVAIKLIKRGMDTDAVVRRFRTERQILANLDHPNIARLMDGGTTEDGLPYFVMEYVKGESINQYCDLHRLSTDKRLQLFRLICSAVNYAHQNLVIHRDLKPFNIIVTEEGVPKLLDFGIAKVLHENPQQATEMTATMMLVMTPEYASPEQVRGERVTTATDIYSLGVVLYEMLTGHRPYSFKSHRPDEVARAICEEEPDKPSTAINRIEELQSTDGTPSVCLTPDFVSATRDGQPEKLRHCLSGDLDNIVLMALRKDPKFRYGSVAQLSEDIRRHLEGLPVLARPATLRYRAAKFVRRNRLGVIAACLIFFTLVSGIVTTTWQARKAREQARIANAKSEEAQKALAKAAKINTFLQSVFSYANPHWFGRAGGKQDMSAMEVMRDVEKRIDTEFAADPEIRADLHQQIGDTYRTQHLLTDAERNLREALRLRLGLYGEDNAKVAETLYILSGVRYVQGDIAEHERLLTQALSIQRRHPNDGNNLPYMMVDYAGFIAKYKADRREALALGLEALELFRQRYGDDHYMIATTQGLLDEFYLNLGDYAQAEVHLREALKRPQDGNVPLRLLELAEIQIIKGDYQAAENSIRQSATNESSEETSASFLKHLDATQALLAQRQGDYTQAKIYSEKALATSSKNEPFYYACVSSLAQSLNKLGKARHAEAILREALEDLKKLPFSENGTQDELSSVLGESLTAQHRFAEAETFLLAAYEAQKARVLPQQRSFTETRQRLATLYRALGKVDEARKYQ
jgi:serine/threonine protein kinase/tetratricopeptide (TPR) repeat protein